MALDIQPGHRHTGNMKLKRIAATVALTLALAACNTNDPQLHETGRILRYTGSSVDTCYKCDWMITLKFEDEDTGESFEDEVSVATAARYLGWLNKNQCYTDPLDQQRVQQVPCG